MKIIAALIIVLFWGTQIGEAAIPVAKPTVVSTPPALKQPHLHQINLRTREEYTRIRKGIKKGKLTKANGTTLLSQLKAIETQEKTDLKQTGAKDLTDTQAVQLNQQLNELSKSLPLL